MLVWLSDISLCERLYFASLFICRETCGLFPAFGYCQPCCHEHVVRCLLDIPDLQTSTSSSQKHRAYGSLLFLPRFQFSGLMLTILFFLWSPCSSAPFCWHCNLFSYDGAHVDWWRESQVHQEDRWGQIYRYVRETAGVKFTQHCSGCVLLKQPLGFPEPWTCVRWGGRACFSLHVRHSAQGWCFFSCDQLFPPLLQRLLSHVCDCDNP